MSGHTHQAPPPPSPPQPPLESSWPPTFNEETVDHPPPVSVPTPNSKHPQSHPYPHPQAPVSVPTPKIQDTPQPQPQPQPHAQPAGDEKWGTHLMGPPAVPTCHPNNQKAALWSSGEGGDQHHPYLRYTPVEKPPVTPLDSVLQKFNSWSTKAESTAHNIWHNLKTGSSVSGSALGKLNLTAKALTGGGFETLYKQSFTNLPDEKLKKTFACYLSTSTGPVAGTLYLSNLHIAFCSDRPLSFTAPSGQQSWSYYKVMVPMGDIGTINPVTMRENGSEKYIQIISIDGNDFWFMGFVSYEKAIHHLSETISSFSATGIPVPPPAVA